MFATLTPIGWTFMLVSCGAVSALAFWCFKRVLTGGGDKPQGPVGLGP